MRARWVFNDLEPKLPGVGMATVASWWPGKYYLVSTIQLDETSVKNYGSITFSPSVEFIQPKVVYAFSKYCDTRDKIVEIKMTVPIGKAVPQDGKYITQVFKCSRIWVYYMEPMTGIVLSQLYRSDLRSHEDRTCEISPDQPPLFELAYENLFDARNGHKRTVELLAAGRLSLKATG